MREPFHKKVFLKANRNYWACFKLMERNRRELNKYWPYAGCLELEHEVRKLIRENKQLVTKARFLRKCALEA